MPPQLRPVPESDQPPTSPTLPHSLEAEQALLGALMIDNRLVEDVQMRLKPVHFFEPLHAKLYERILTLTDKTMIASPITLHSAFAGDEALKEAGGPAYLVGLTEAVGPVFAAGEYARHIYDLAMLRELARVGREMASTALDPSCGRDPAEQVEDAEMALFRVAEAGEIAGSVKSFREAGALAIRMAEIAHKSGGGLSGVTTGLDALNHKIGGLHRSDLVILAGRPAMGKTALATNIAFSAARRAILDGWTEKSADSYGGPGAAVAFFSLEMSAEQLAARILAEQSNISGERLRKGEISHAEFRDLARAAQELHDLPLLIDDTPALTIAALRTRARRLKRQKKIGMVVIDYLQLLQGSQRNASSGDNRVAEVSEITRGLKNLAKELNVPVLALSQLSRAVEQREDKRPQLADLRESGTIEQDADIVLFVYREEYYHAQKKPEDGSEKFDKWLEKATRIDGRAEVIVGKQRHGSTGAVPLMFHKATTKFSDIAEGDGWQPDSYE
jgi:replicative DNA helicase